MTYIMYVCMYSHRHSKNIDQSGKVANSVRGQPLSVRVRAREFGLARRVRPFRPASALLILHTQAESGAYLRDSSRFPRRRPFINLNRHMTRNSGGIPKHQIQLEYGE